jgi:DNA-binding MarR family transcriptional regulator
VAERDAVDEVFDLISRTMYSALLGSAEMWAKLDITMPQLKVLMLLGLHGSAPVSWLASRMNVSPPNVTGILDRLEHEPNGWVKRTNDAHDRRVVRVVLTEKGQRLLQDLQASGNERVRMILEEMKPDERAALREGLSALLTRAETAAVPAAEPTTGARARETA